MSQLKNILSTVNVDLYVLSLFHLHLHSILQQCVNIIRVSENVSDTTDCFYQWRKDNPIKFSAFIRDIGETLNYLLRHSAELEVSTTSDYCCKIYKDLLNQYQIIKDMKSDKETVSESWSSIHVIIRCEKHNIQEMLIHLVEVHKVLNTKKSVKSWEPNSE